MSNLGANLQKGLVGHWTMDDRDTDNGMLRDRSGYGNHGSLKNTVSTGESSIIGESYDFNIDGTNGYILTNNLLVSSSEITISLWAKIETTDERNYMFDTQSPRLPLIKWDDGNTSVLTWGMGGNYISYTQGNRVGEWVHYVLLCDGTTERLYVDSIEVDSQSQVTSTIDLDELYIGEYNSLGYSTNGNLSDFRIYNRVLSESEIQQLYNMRSQRTSNI